MQKFKTIQLLNIHNIKLSVVKLYNVGIRHFYSAATLNGLLIFQEFWAE